MQGLKVDFRHLSNRSEEALFNTKANIPMGHMDSLVVSNKIFSLISYLYIAVISAGKKYYYYY